MKTIVQRVRRAAVWAEGTCTGEIGAGFFVLLGVHASDTEAEAKLLARKVANLRVLSDENDKLNLSLLDTGAGALVVSNFTLCADTRKGNRPSFAQAKEPHGANALYLRFCEELKLLGVKDVQTGSFGAAMEIDLVADGPITISLDTDLWRKP